MSDNGENTIPPVTAGAVLSLAIIGLVIAAVAITGFEQAVQWVWAQIAGQAEAVGEASVHLLQWALLALLILVAGLFVISLLVDLVWIGVSALAGQAARRRAAAGIPLPRDAVLRGWQPAASEIEELLRDMLATECARRWPVSISQLSSEELAALRMEVPPLIRRPEYEGRIRAELVAPLYALAVEHDIEIEHRLRVHCSVRKRRPFFVTGRLLHRLTPWGLLGMSQVGSYRCPDVDHLRSDEHAFARWVLTHGLAQIDWLVKKIARGLVLEERTELPTEKAYVPAPALPTPQPDPVVSEPEPAPEPEPPADPGPDPELVAAAQRLVAEAAELIDDEEFWMADDAHEQVAPVLDALREAIDHHPDPVEVERVKSAIERRLADVLAYEEFFAECMSEDYDYHRWPRCISLALGECSERPDPEELRRLAKRKYLFGLESDREPQPIEGEAEAASDSAREPEPLLSLVPGTGSKADPHRADTLF